MRLQVIAHTQPDMYKAALVQGCTAMITPLQQLTLFVDRAPYMPADL